MAASGWAQGPGAIGPGPRATGPLKQGPGPWDHWTRAQGPLDKGPGPWDHWTRALGPLDKGPGPWDHWTRAQGPLDQKELQPALAKPGLRVFAIRLYSQEFGGANEVRDLLRCVTS